MKRDTIFNICVAVFGTIAFLTSSNHWYLPHRLLAMCGVFIFLFVLLTGIDKFTYYLINRGKELKNG